MSQALAKQEPQGLQRFDQSQLELIKNTICKGATDEEFSLFVQICNRTKLDPFTRQIYCIERRYQENGQWKRKMEPQTGIDGYRVVAERTEKYEGQIGPFWCGEDGQWRDVWISKQPPSAAKVGAVKAGCREPFWGVALYSEYVQTNKDGIPTKFWKNQPANQLAKCAESLALRKAFPNDLSGLYTRDEMAQAENEYDEPSTQGAIHAEAVVLVDAETATAITNLWPFYGPMRDKALIPLEVFVGEKGWSDLYSAPQVKARELLDWMIDRKTKHEAKIQQMNGAPVEPSGKFADWACTPATALTLLEHQACIQKINSTGDDATKADMFALIKQEFGTDRTSRKQLTEEEAQYLISRMSALMEESAQPEPKPAASSPSPLAKSVSELATPKQIVMARAICRDLNLDLDSTLQDTLKVDAKIEEITRKAASDFISHLKSLQAAA